METEIKTQAPSVPKKLKHFAKEYKYPLVVLALGALLVLAPFGRKTAQKEQTPVPEPVNTAASQESYAEQTEKRLAQILSGIRGAGKVEVMLTVRGSDITFFQTDSDSSSEEKDGETRRTTQYKTVILSGSGEYDKAAVIKTEYPAFQGALIVSQGADDAAVRLSLVNAVSALLGLGTDKISVVKMK